MAPQRVFGCRRQPEIVRRLQYVAIHLQVAQQRSHAEQRAAGIVAHHQHPLAHRLNPIAFRAGYRRDEWRGGRRSHQGEARFPADVYGRSGAWPTVAGGKPDARALLDFIEQHRHGSLFRPGQIGRWNHHRVSQVQCRSGFGNEKQNDGGNR